MSNHLEIAAANLKAAVDNINEDHEEFGVDITSAQLLKIAEVSALTSIAYSLAGGKTKKSGPFKVEGVTALDVDEAIKKINEKTA